MNALELLKNDHETIFELFGQVKASRNKRRHRRLFETIKSELETHTFIEEKVFYPFVAENAELKALIFEEAKEDKHVKDMLSEISALSVTSGLFERKLMLLINEVESHINEEIRIFKQIGEILDNFQLEEIGAELVAEKQDYAEYGQYNQ